MCIHSECCTVPIENILCSEGLPLVNLIDKLYAFAQKENTYFGFNVEICLKNELF